MCGGGLEMRIVAPDHKENKVCTKCGFVYFLGPKLVAGCIVADGDRTLLLRRGIEPSRGKWTYPGGFVDLGETPEKCAMRETLEEVGITVREPELMGVYADRREPSPIIVVTYVGSPAPKLPSSRQRRPRSATSASMRSRGTDLAFDTTIQAMEAWAARFRQQKH